MSFLRRLFRSRRVAPPNAGPMRDNWTGGVDAASARIDPEPAAIEDRADFIDPADAVDDPPSAPEPSADEPAVPTAPPLRMPRALARRQQLVDAGLQILGQRFAPRGLADRLTPLLGLSNAVGGLLSDLIPVGGAATATTNIMRAGGLAQTTSSVLGRSMGSSAASAPTAKRTDSGAASVREARSGQERDLIVPMPRSVPMPSRALASGPDEGEHPFAVPRNPPAVAPLTVAVDPDDQTTGLQASAARVARLRPERSDAWASEPDDREGLVHDVSRRLAAGARATSGFAGRVARPAARAGGVVVGGVRTSAGAVARRAQGGLRTLVAPADYREQARSRLGQLMRTGVKGAGKFVLKKIPGVKPVAHGVASWRERRRVRQLTSLRPNVSGSTAQSLLAGLAAAAGRGRVDHGVQAVTGVLENVASALTLGVGGAVAAPVSTALGHVARAATNVRSGAAAVADIRRDWHLRFAAMRDPSTSAKDAADAFRAMIGTAKYSRKFVKLLQPRSHTVEQELNRAFTKSSLDPQRRSPAHHARAFGVPETNRLLVRREVLGASRNTEASSERPTNLLQQLVAIERHSRLERIVE